MIEYLFYIITLILVLLIFIKLNSYNLIDCSILFFLLTNLLLNFSTAIFFLYFKNYLFSLISIFMLFIFSLYMYKDIKRILGYFPLSYVPYILFIIYKLFEISIIFVQSI